jgi:hypothetical protein
MNEHGDTTTAVNLSIRSSMVPGDYGEGDGSVALVGFVGWGWPSGTGEAMVGWRNETEECWAGQKGTGGRAKGRTNKKRKRGRKDWGAKGSGEMKGGRISTQLGELRM